MILNYFQIILNFQNKIPNIISNFQNKIPNIKLLNTFIHDNSYVTCILLHCRPLRSHFDLIIDLIFNKNLLIYRNLVILV